MLVCEFCLQYKQSGECALGLKIPEAFLLRANEVIE